MLTWISVASVLGIIASSLEDVSAKTPQSTEVAIFSAGCFWCEAEAFKHLPGVISVISGYTGGHTLNPTYEQVSGEKTGHKESVEITFDPTKISYDQLLEVYWRNVDPFNADGQFCDRGDSYKAAIFYTDDIQKQKAEMTKKNLETMFNKSFVVDIQAASTFYPAEDYHQDYAEKNPLRYKFYRYSCGRDKRLLEVWKKK
jgi:peptide-methionine (S)-S-oxide reductase